MAARRQPRRGKRMFKAAAAVALALFASAAAAADCPSAASAPEKAICADAALTALDARIEVGNCVRHLVALDPMLSVRETLARAADARLLPPVQQSLPARPIYGRAPDARPNAP